jgi:hypothetical protein
MTVPLIINGFFVYTPCSSRSTTAPCSSSTARCRGAEPSSCLESSSAPAPTIYHCCHQRRQHTDSMQPTFHILFFIYKIRACPANVKTTIEARPGSLGIPFASSKETISRCPKEAAACNGRAPPCRWIFTSAPASKIARLFHDEHSITSEAAGRPSCSDFKQT